jgi:hypothetical protein
MIKTTISEVFSSSYGPEDCRGLMTEGSGADGPDVAGGVVRVAPIDFEAASPRNESQPEMRSTHAGTQHESTLRNLLTHRRLPLRRGSLVATVSSVGRRLSLVGVGKPGDGPGPDDLTCFCVIVSDASLPPKGPSMPQPPNPPGHSHSPSLSHSHSREYCNVGWQNAVSREHIAWSGPQNETWYRRVCSLSGLDLSDREWGFLSRYDSRVGGNVEMTNYGLANAAFVDEFDAVVTCEIGGDPGPNGEWSSRGGVQLQSAAPGAQPAGVCPVHAEPSLFTNGPGSSARTVTVNGAGAVRDKAGAKMGNAEALRLHVPGGSVTVTVPVVKGIALADFELKPTHAVPIDPTGKIALAGDVLDASGRTVATCG